MKTVYLMYETIPLPVISSGGIMPLEDTAKAATATRSREIFLVVGNTGLFNAFHLSRFAANAPPQPSAAPPMGEPSFNGAVWTLIFFTQISILSFYTGTPPPQAVPLPSKEGRLGAFCGEAAGTQLSNLNSQLFLFNAPIGLYAHSATRTKRAPIKGSSFCSFRPYLIWLFSSSSAFFSSWISFSWFWIFWS